jgi:hypothetical protein
MSTFLTTNECQLGIHICKKEKLSTSTYIDTNKYQVTFFIAQSLLSTHRLSYPASVEAELISGEAR